MGLASVQKHQASSIKHHAASTKISSYQAIKLLGFMTIQLYGYMAMWLRGYVAMLHLYLINLFVNFVHYRAFLAFLSGSYHSIDALVPYRKCANR